MVRDATGRHDHSRAAGSKPLVGLDDSAVRFTPKESETPSAFTVAERNVSALIRNEDSSDGSSRDGSQRPGGSAKLRRCADSRVEKSRVVGGQQRWSRKLHVRSTGPGFCQAFAKARKTPTDARTVRTAVVAKMVVLEENLKPVFCETDFAGEKCT